jgi:hypothetical protein
MRESILSSMKESQMMVQAAFYDVARAVFFL